MADPGHSVALTSWHPQSQGNAGHQNFQLIPGKQTIVIYFESYQSLKCYIIN